MASKPNDHEGKDGRTADGDTSDGEATLTPLRRSGGSSSLGTTIGGIMHGIDADIFRDPAAIQRMERDKKATLRTADGTVVGIELPGEGILTEDPPDDAA